MRDRSEATRALIELCTRWASTFPDRWSTHLPLGDGRPHREVAREIGRELKAYPWPVGRGPSLDPRDWAALRDTGTGDTLEHAAEVLTGEHGFAPVAEHTVEVNGHPHPLRLFVFDGVLAQLEGLRRTDDGPWLVSNIYAWGCAHVTDWELFHDLTMASYGDLHSDRDLPAESRRQHLQLSSLFAGSFGLSWLPAAAAVDQWVTPWPEPAVRTWLGPREPGPAVVNPDIDEARRAGYRNTAALLARLPDHVHARLGTIATRS